MRGPDGTPASPRPRNALAGPNGRLACGANASRFGGLTVDVGDSFETTGRTALDGPAVGVVVVVGGGRPIGLDKLIDGRCWLSRSSSCSRSRSRSMWCGGSSRSITPNRGRGGEWGAERATSGLAGKLEGREGKSFWMPSDRRNDKAVAPGRAVLAAGPRGGSLGRIELAS